MIHDIVSNIQDQLDKLKAMLNPCTINDKNCCQSQSSFSNSSMIIDGFYYHKCGCGNTVCENHMKTYSNRGMIRFTCPICDESP